VSVLTQKQHNFFIFRLVSSIS